jgi:hypothetical protein
MKILKKFCSSVVHEQEIENKGYCSACKDIILNKLNGFRKSIENENISYGEISELQSLAEHIDKDDTLLLEWSGICECCQELPCSCAGVSK